MEFDGKVVLVTGSTSGMGTTEAFAREGAQVVVTGRNADAGESVVRTIRQAGGDAVFVRADMTDKKGIRKLFDVSMEQYGRIDVLVNNAGIFDKYAALLDTSEELWDLIYDVNVKAVFRLCKLVLPQMIERHEGSIVNIASIAGMVANKGGAAYTSSKHAVIGLTKHLSSA